MTFEYLPPGPRRPQDLERSFQFKCRCGACDAAMAPSELVASGATPGLASVAEDSDRENECTPPPADDIGDAPADVSDVV